MKKIILILAVAFTGLMAVSSCSKDKIIPDTPDVPELSVSPKNISAQTVAGSYSINVAGNIPWTATSSTEWCSITPASGNASGTVTVNVAENTAVETRTATVTVKADNLTKTVAVTQLGTTPALSVSMTEINIPATATDSTIAITSNMAWTATSNQTWCTVTPASGKGSGAVTVNVSENTALETRTATVTVEAGDLTCNITVAQNAAFADAELTVTLIHQTIFFDASAQKIVVYWGDGTTDEYSNLNMTTVYHSYPENNSIYTIRIKEEGLTYLSVIANANVTNLNVNGCMELTLLSCSDDQLTGLDISNNRKLMYFDCNSNQFTSLDVSNNTELEELSCHYNQLTSLDVSNNKKLTILDCWNNQLTNLDVSNNEKLTDLGCDHNQLTSLDISNNKKLMHLRCNNNQFTSLDISNNTELTELYCDYNQLTGLNMSNHTKLWKLYCRNNRLSATALNEIFAALPTRLGSVGYMRISGNPGASTCNRSIAENKGWSVSY